MFLYPIDIDSSGNRTVHLGGEHEPKYRFVSTLVSHDFPVYEIAVHPNEAKQYEFQSVYRDGQYNLYSSKVAVSVVKPPPKATFSAAVKKVQLGSPFTATCTIANFDVAANPKYSIAFYNKRDGLLGRYENSNGQHILDWEQHANVSVHHGSRTSFPVFDLKITESKDKYQSYWCALEVANGDRFQSNHWQSEPVLVLGTTVSSASERIGTCSIDNFEPAGKDYAVKFVTDFGGDKSENLLATYFVKGLCKPFPFPDFILKTKYLHLLQPTKSPSLVSNTFVIGAR